MTLEKNFINIGKTSQSNTDNDNAEVFLTFYLTHAIHSFECNIDYELKTLCHDLSVLA